jgi:hypothetical protein
MMVVVSGDDVNVLTYDTITEGFDLLKPTKTPIAQMKKNIILSDFGVDVIHQCIVHFIQ